MPQDSFIDQFSDYLRAGKETIVLLQAAVGLMPKGEDRTKVEAEIERAEHALKMSEARAAQSLGYKLCQCTLPPQIMLSKGYHDVHNVELFVCPQCDKQHPSQHQIRQYDKVKVHNEGLRGQSWVDARRGR